MICWWKTFRFQSLLFQELSIIHFRLLLEKMKLEEHACKLFFYFIINSLYYYLYFL